MLRTFFFEKDGLVVVYKAKDGIATDTMFVTDKTLPDDGRFNRDGLGKTRVDLITKEEKKYIQNQLDESTHCLQSEKDIQRVGNKVCEVYHGMIK